MNHDDDRFWGAVHESLDERREPLDDDRLRAMLAATPERQDVLLRLEGRLAALAAGAIERRRPPILMLGLLGGAAALLLCGVSLFGLARSDPRQECEMPRARAPAILRLQSDHTVHSHRSVSVWLPESPSPEPVLTMTTTQVVIGAFR